MDLRVSRIVRFGVFVAVLLVPQVVVFAQSSRLSGQVFGLNRRPVSELHVELLNDVEAVIMRTRTNSSGTYGFSGLAAGRYSVRVRPFGTNYEEQTQEVEIVTYVGGRQVADHQQRDFYLRLRKDLNRETAAPAVVFAQEVPDDAKRAYDRALSNLGTSRPDLGMQELWSAIAIFPKYFLALDLLGVELLKQQKFADAIPIFERAVAVNEKSSNSWYGLAFCHYALNNVPKSVEAARKAGVANPDSADIALMLGISLRRDRQYTEAEKVLLKAKKLSQGKLPDVHWNLALLYAHNLRNYRQAAEELENYLRSKPDHPDALLLKKLIQQFRMQS